MIEAVIFAIAFGTAQARAVSAAPPAPSPLSSSAPAVATRKAKEPPASLTRDMPLREAIDILRQTTSPPLNIIVYWKDLRETAEIHSDTPIGFDGFAGLGLEQSLDALVNSLSATSPARIGYVVDRGVIVIATANTLPRPREITRVHDVRDLVAPPARWSFSPMIFGIMSNNLGQSRPLGTAPSDTRQGATSRR